MKWTSPVRRRRLDGVGEPMEVVLDDELLQTPPGRRPPPRTKKSAEDTEEGTDMSSKWSLEQLRKEYEKMGISYEEVFKDVKNLCIKTLMAVEPQITTAMRATKHRA